MKAITYHRYGGPEVLQLEELDRPEPKENELLIKTHATTVTSGDWRVRSLSMPVGLGLIARLMFGITGPRQTVLGSELAGEVVQLGRSVANFKVGDRVVVFTGAKLGCSVEYRCMPSDGNVVKIPDQLSYCDAVSLPFGGTTALDFFRKGNLAENECVLINGASGCVGTLAVQIAKHFGARVTGVCSTTNVDLVKSLGADEVIDYTAEDFTKSGKKYDVIMDTAASAPYSRCKGSLNDGGRMLVVNGGLFDLFRGPFLAMVSNKKLIAGPAAEKLDDLRQLVTMAADQTIQPVIHQVFPVQDFADAHRVVDTGRKKGSVVVDWS